MKRQSQYRSFISHSLMVVVVLLISMLNCDNSKAKSDITPEHEFPQPREVVQGGTSSTEETAGMPYGEWPQWRGPNRDGISTETEFLKTWPEGGPEVLWRTSIGQGFSGISVSQGLVYTMEITEGDEFVVCLNASNGKEVWRFRTGKMFSDSQGGNGPRSTPTVDHELVFAIGAYGKLYALAAKTGEKVWGLDMIKKFKGKVPTWGFSTSLIIEGELLLVETGGAPGSALVAFDKRTGDVVWRSYDDIAGYSSPIAVTIDGIRQIIFFSGTSVVSVSPTDGKFYWKYDWRTSYDVNAATPVFVPPNNVFISSGYDTGAALFRITTHNGNPTAEPTWKSRVMRNQFSSSILYGGYLYGFDEATLKCINAGSGEEIWKNRGFGKGSITLADGHLIVLSDRGKLALAEATPSGFTEKASAQVLDGRCWTVPTLAGGRLYLRNVKEIVCLNLLS